MDDRPPATLSDETLDRELRAALDVAPSPEFVARLRTRVASEIQPTRGLTRWHWMAGATASVAVAVAVTVMLGSIAPESVSPVGPPGSAEVRVSHGPVSAQRPVADLAGPLPGARPAPRAAASESRARVEPILSSGVASNRVARVMPEVLISADEQRALQQLLRMASASEAAAALLEQPMPAPGQELPALDIRSIDIEPLPQLAQLE